MNNIEFSNSEKRLPYQVLETTGISQDYYNTVNAYAGALGLGVDTLREFLEKKIIQPVKTYQQYFPDDQFKNVITDLNRDRVECLNQLAAEINSLCTNPAQIQCELLQVKLDEFYSLTH
jgi:hypothetical protein